MLVRPSEERGKEQRGKDVRQSEGGFWVPRATSAGRQKGEGMSKMNPLTLSLDYTWDEMIKNKKREGRLAT